MSDEEITISIPVKRTLQSHIESLQGTLTKRNEQIERLEQRVAEAEAGEPNREALGRAYERGWEDACNRLSIATADAARSLARVRKETLAIYYGYRE